MVIVKGSVFALSVICVDAENDQHLMSIQMKDAANKKYKFKLGALDTSLIQKLTFNSKVTVKCDEYNGKNSRLKIVN